MRAVSAATGAVLIAAALASALASAPVAAQTGGAMPADEIRRAVETTHGVQVLRVTETALEDGTPAYRVAAMLPESAGNAAFQVVVLTIDAVTGLAVPPFRHGASGYTQPDGNRYEPNRSTANPAAARGHTWR